MVKYVSVRNMVELLNELGPDEFLRGLTRYIEDDYLRWDQFCKTARVANHSDEGVIELMPINDEAFYSFKYVNGHPKNYIRNLQTVVAFGVFADVTTGYPLLCSEMTILTALRTAAMSAVAAKHLAPEGSDCMAIVGNGAQCEFQALAFKAILGGRKLRLYDIDKKMSWKAAANLSEQGFDVSVHDTPQEAVEGAQIIATATADKKNATILTDNMIGSGVHINAIGGDCPGKTEIHSDILQRADIFVEFEEQTRIEGEIQQLPADHSVTKLCDVISGRAPGRRTRSQITVFDSVGFAIEDFSALRFVHDLCTEYGHYEQLDLISELDDPRNLYALVNRSGDGL